MLVSAALTISIVVGSSIIATCDSQLIISSPRETNFGEWGDWERCPQDTYVMAMRIKTEPYQGPWDDTGLNGVQLMCGRVGESSRTIQNRRIQSSVGKWGSWGNSLDCPKGYAVGFQLRSEPLQENGGDNTAANNARMYCSGYKGFLEGAGLNTWGQWTRPQLCPLNYALCGLRTQVQSPQGRGTDDTALNNVDMECCPFIQES